MARSISNMNQLASALAPILQGMVNQMADRVYETLNFYLQGYYTGWTPSSYRRTYGFLYSAVKTEARMVHLGQITISQTPVLRYSEFMEQPCHCKGVGLPYIRREVVLMYFSFQDLMAFGLFIIALLTFIFNNRK